MDELYPPYARPDLLLGLTSIYFNFSRVLRQNPNPVETKDGEPDQVRTELRGRGWQREGGHHQQPEVAGSLPSVGVRPSGAHAQARAMRLVGVSP